uniref:CSON010367 protein n=1 Tax=Culicoides sonorensis TaxID=179676 RepID=A0A336LLT0_CULSO
MIMSDFERTRVVLLGDAGVGKTCIIKRFLSKTYSDKYRATVEDLYNREYDLGPVTLKVDILDTAGDIQFPAMRRLSIATAHAFLLVYATTSAQSFTYIKQCFEEIREQRADFQEIPIVIAGNKLDLANTHREVSKEDVSEWVYCELPRLKVKVLECSAKDDINVTDLFKTMLSLSRILVLPGSNDQQPTTGLKRRSSAYVSATSKGKRDMSAASSSNDTRHGSPSFLNTSNSSTESAKSKPRSRSLIRRSSRKTKQQIQNAEDCSVQ